MKTDDEFMQELAVAGARVRLAQLERERDELLVMFPDLAVERARQGAAPDERRAKLLQNLAKARIALARKRAAVRETR